MPKTIDELLELRDVIVTNNQHCDPISDDAKRMLLENIKLKVQKNELLLLYFF